MILYLSRDFSVQPAPKAKNSWYLYCMIQNRIGERKFWIMNRGTLINWPKEPAVKGRRESSTALIANQDSLITTSANLKGARHWCYAVDYFITWTCIFLYTLIVDETGTLCNKIFFIILLKFCEPYVKQFYIKV